MLIMTGPAGGLSWGNKATYAGLVQADNIMEKRINIERRFISNYGAEGVSGVSVGVGVLVAVFVAVGVEVTVGVAVAVGVRVGVRVDVAVGPGGGDCVAVEVAEGF
jgi:hypothetical protein